MNYRFILDSAPFHQIRWLNILKENEGDGWVNSYHVENIVDELIRRKPDKDVLEHILKLWPHTIRVMATPSLSASLRALNYDWRTVVYRKLPF